SNCRAAAPSVPEPAKKSITQSPGREEAATIRRTNPRGFWVGYPVFSLPVGDTIVCHHTSVGSFPRSRFSLVTRPGAILGARSTSAESNQYFFGSFTETKIVSCLEGQRLRARPP